MVINLVVADMMIVFVMTKYIEWFHHLANIILYILVDFVSKVFEFILLYEENIEYNPSFRFSLHNAFKNHHFHPT